MGEGGGIGDVEDMVLSGGGKEEEGGEMEEGEEEEEVEEAKARRTSGTSMLKAVLSHWKAEAGRGRSSAQRRPRRDAFWVVA